MEDFTGTILREGVSPSGNYYSKEVLQDAVEKFNENSEGEGVLGCISTSSPLQNLNEKSYISHTTTKLTFDGKNVNVRINFLNNEYGRQLISLLSNVPQSMKVTPVINGTIKNGEVEHANICRVDFVYDKSKNDT